METESRELAVQAFRSGARGLFPRLVGSTVLRTSRRSVCHSQTAELSSRVSLPGALSAGRERWREKLLTSHEDQVMALVADGLSNRDVATEVGLSEHTVKK